MCAADDRITGFLPPGIQFERTQTCPNGLLLCVFRYLRQPECSR